MWNQQKDADVAEHVVFSNCNAGESHARTSATVQSKHDGFIRLFEERGVYTWWCSTDMFDCLRGLVAYSRGWGTGGRVIFSSSCASFWVSLGWDRNGDPTSVANALQNRNLVVSACFSHSFSIHISKLQDVAPSFFWQWAFQICVFLLQLRC